MHFESVEIKNFKGIKDMEISFCPGINLLTGDNGVGKTAILEALIISLGGFFSGIKGVTARGVFQTDVRFEKKSVGDASYFTEYFRPVVITGIVCNGEEKFTCTRIRNDETGESRTSTNAKKWSVFVKQLVNDPKSELPLFSYHSTARVTQFRREDFGKASRNKLDDRRCGYIGCLDSSKDIKSIKDWCLKMEMAEYRKKRSISEYEAFKEIVATVMQKMSELEERPQIYYSEDFEDMVYCERGREIPVKYLSAGYQSLLWMTMDMAFRLALLNPERKDLKTAKGIVLIDEIDMHLHPKWQWKVLQVLEETFPNIQFIIATHSAIIIASCKRGNLIRIKEDQEIQYLPDAYAYSVEDVLELRQGSSGRLAELRKMYCSFEEALNRDDYHVAAKIVDQMANLFGADNTEVKNARMELELV